MLDCLPALSPALHLALHFNFSSTTLTTVWLPLLLLLLPVPRTQSSHDDNPGAPAAILSYKYAFMFSYASMNSSTDRSPATDMTMQFPGTPLGWTGKVRQLGRVRYQSYEFAMHRCSIAWEKVCFGHCLQTTQDTACRLMCQQGTTNVRDTMKSCLRSTRCLQSCVRFARVAALTTTRWLGTGSTLSI
jgi:hypothetical protein